MSPAWWYLSALRSSSKEGWCGPLSRAHGREAPRDTQSNYEYVECPDTGMKLAASFPIDWMKPTFRITCDGSVLSIALRYCCMAVS